MLKYFKISLIILIALGVGIFFLPKENQAARSPDVIGLRVIPNLNHWSAQRWYKEQKFVGSPQSLVVDGYEAVRDGRTVYINVANIGINNGISVLYTNINVISYNQEAESATMDIFGQILNHWKFNINNTEEEKKDIIKDTARLAYLVDIEIALENYKSKKGYYPKLSAGSYLTNKTISTWPSWQGTLGKELGITLPVDPVNKLGSCGGGGYNKETCWNDKDRKFATILPKLPIQSQVFYYSASTTSVSYNLCAVMSAGYIKAGGRACIGSNYRNNPPKINFTPSECSGSVRIGGRYNCEISVSDPDDNTISVEGLSGQPAGFSSKLENGIITISGLPAKNEEGIYSLKVAIKDEYGAAVDKSFSLSVNTYCGDGTKQDINGEGIREQCDGNAGVPVNAACKPDCSSFECAYRYHIENNVCVSDVKYGCAHADINALNTYQSWSGTWGICNIDTCKDGNLNSGYHITQSGDKCESNTQDCVGATGIANASSTVKYWNNNFMKWNSCELKTCNIGFHKVGNSCIGNRQNCINKIFASSEAWEYWNGTSFGPCTLVKCKRWYRKDNNLCRR